MFNADSTRMRFFIIDDHPEIRSIVRSIVSTPNDVVYEFDEANELDLLYGMYKPDWVLLDVKMRYSNGIVSMTELLRQYPDANVIIVTNYNDKRLREAALKAGARGFVVKDDLQQLTTLIHK